MNKRLGTIAILAVLTICSSGCFKMKQLGSTEVGIKVVNLPDFVGGGIKNDTVSPGSFKVYAPWTSIYSMDTQLQSYTWAALGSGDTPNVDERINTRAADGNEVHLGMTIQYHLIPEMVKNFLSDIGSGEREGKAAVQHWARSHIRTYLGFLHTEEFYDNTRRYQQCDVAKASLNRDLQRFGIYVDKVIFDEHTFADDYQKLIDAAKESEQKAQGKANEVKTKEADWKMQLQTAIGGYNQMVAEANGKKRQKIATADAYYQACENQAKAIQVAGEKEVEGIKKQIEALKQAGGENIVRLEYGKALIESPAEFFVLPGGSQGMNLNTTNYNDLLKTMGMVSLVPKSPASQEVPVNQPSPKGQ